MDSDGMNLVNLTDYPGEDLAAQLGSSRDYPPDKCHHHFMGAGEGRIALILIETASDPEP